MIVSDIMITKVLSLAEEDTVAKAFSLMIDNSIHQIPLAADDGKYVGMIFAKQFLGTNPMPSSKLKHFMVRAPMLSPQDSIEKAAQLVLGSGNRAMPVVEKGRLAGIVSETDIVLTADFGHATVDEVMSGAIVIEQDTKLSDALSKMRRYNISRLPVIDGKGILRGTINALDVGKIISKPKERTSKSAGITGDTADIKDVKVKDIMRRVVSVERGTRLNSVIENFRKNEEIVVVGDGRPIGIVSPKDALELILPKKSGPVVHVAHLEEEEARREIHDELTRFLEKIQGKIEDVTSLIVYADRHKTRKYSLRSRLVTSKGVIDAKAVGYDPISASKELISRLERRVKSEHSQRVKGREHRESVRKF